MTDTPKLLSEICWLAYKYHFDSSMRSDRQCIDLCSYMECTEIINKTCPDILIVPNRAIAFGHIHLAFEKEALMKANAWPVPQYVCYDDRLCGGFSPNKTLLTLNNLACRRPEDFPIKFNGNKFGHWIDMYIGPIYKQLHQCNTIIHSHLAYCNSSMMYQCQKSSKCISISHLCDGFDDCNYKDDENCTLFNGTCATFPSVILFKCPITNQCI